eukprot:1473907-Alexandrium_andersonii.AAC.1
MGERAQTGRLGGIVLKKKCLFNKHPLCVVRESSSWSLSGLPDPPGWRLRRERPLRGGYRPPGPPDWRLRRAGGA